MTQDEEIFKVEVGWKLRDIRKLAGLSQEDLANGVGLTRTSIVNIEKGKQSLTISTIYSISKFLKISPTDLFPDSKNSISLVIKANIHKLEIERDEWKKKYTELTNLLSTLKSHIP